MPAPRTINLNLTGIQAAGNATTYVNIERMNILGGAGDDILTSRTSNANDGFVDTLNGGLGNDIVTVGGGLDVVDGGAGGDDLLIIDYSTDTGNFSMFGANVTISDGSNTQVNFTNIERFNATFGSGNDIIVLGAGNDTLNGGGGNNSLNTGAGAAVVDGGAGGSDLWIADFSGDSTIKNINLNLAGIQSAGNGTTYVNIERMNILGGAGDDILTSRVGNPNDGFTDALNGGLGNDTLTVGGGIDTVDGGAGGDDLLIIDYATDTNGLSTFSGGALFSDGTNTQVAFSNMERIVATFGLGADNISIGGSSSDRIVAAAASDGFDTFNGGAGIDTLDYSALGSINDISITLNGAVAVTLFVTGGSNDTVSNFENVIGSQGDDTVTGDSLANTLRGEGGADSLSGGGGADVINGGALKDDSFGGAGDDTFLITGADFGDNVYGGADNDVLDLSGWTNAAVAFNINLQTQNYQQLPNLNGANGTYDLQGVENVRGTGFNDVITGDAFANILVGGGGLDTMAGGGGDDSFYVDNAGDTVSELAAEGVLDTIFSSVTFTSSLNVERMYLTGTGNINGTGVNGQNDIMYGNSGNNILDGLGGTDNMNGGLGNDTYYVNTSGDVINEAAAAGTDTIFAQSSYTIALNAERLFLLERRQLQRQRPQRAERLPLRQQPKQHHQRLFRRRRDPGRLRQ